MHVCILQEMLQFELERLVDTGNFELAPEGRACFYRTGIVLGV
jgi:hypothetical protein